MNDNQRLGVALIKMFELKGKGGYTETTIKIWIEKITEKGHSVEEIENAINRIIDSMERFPMSSDVMAELGANLEVNAGKEWEKIRNALRSGKEPQMTEPQKAALKLAGGLYKLRTSTNEYDKDQMKKVFVSNYKVDKQEILE